jgi:hypothetical protein
MREKKYPMPEGWVAVTIPCGPGESMLGLNIKAREWMEREVKRFARDGIEAQIVDTPHSTITLARKA